MRTLFSAPRWLLLACSGFIAVTWLDVLDQIETVTLLRLPGYAEANHVLSAGGVASIIAIKLVIPIIIGLLLIVTYRRSALQFRLLTLTLWLAVIPYAAVVIHNLYLFTS